jgi:hypothetical protein
LSQKIAEGEIFSRTVLVQSYFACDEVKMRSNYPHQTQVIINKSVLWVAVNIAKVEVKYKLRILLVLPSCRPLTPSSYSSAIFYPSIRLED